MITTGLDLFVASKTQLVNFLLFLSDIPPLSLRLQDRLVNKLTNKCLVFVLSLLYLNCHVLLLIFGYGNLINFTPPINKLRSVVDNAVGYLVGCLPELVKTDIRREKNLEILFEILWVLLMTKRYISDLSENFPPDLVDIAGHTL